MSTNIQTGNMPVNINNHKNSKTAEPSHNSAPVRTQPTKSIDTVSITDEVSRLQELEARLAAIPVVNDAAVAEMSQAIAAGTFEIDLQGIASKLIEMESGVLDSGND